MLGDTVECNQFQDAKAFLENGGMKGPQIALLRPGTYRINSRAFIISKKEITKVNEEKIGIVVAMDGKPLPPGYIIAPKPENDIHKFYQDGQAFIISGGYRGPQELAKDKETPPEMGKHLNLRQELHEKDEVVLTTDRNERGIWREPQAA